MPKALNYPTENWRLENGGTVLWEEGGSSSKDGLIVTYVCTVCKKPGRAAAKHVLKLGERFRALHRNCKYVPHAAREKMSAGLPPSLGDRHPTGWQRFRVKCD